MFLGNKEELFGEIFEKSSKFDYNRQDFDFDHMQDFDHIYSH